MVWQTNHAPHNPAANVPQTRQTGSIDRRPKAGAAQPPSKLITVSKPDTPNSRPGWQSFRQVPGRLLHFSGAPLDQMGASGPRRFLPPPTPGPGSPGPHARPSRACPYASPTVSVAANFAATNTHRQTNHHALSHHRAQLHRHSSRSLPAAVTLSGAELTVNFASGRAPPGRPPRSALIEHAADSAAGAPTGPTARHLPVLIEHAAGRGARHPRHPM